MYLKYLNLGKPFLKQLFFNRKWMKVDVTNSALPPWILKKCSLYEIHLLSIIMSKSAFQQNTSGLRLRWQTLDAIFPQSQAQSHKALAMKLFKEHACTTTKLSMMENNFCLCIFEFQCPLNKKVIFNIWKWI